MRYLNSIVCSIVLLTLFSLPKTATAQSYNAALDFSSTTNPSGQWSYGWSQTSGSTFNLLPNTTVFSGFAADGFTPLTLNVWTSDCCGTVQPLVEHNSAPEMYFSGTATVPPDTLCYGCSYMGGLSLHPGPNGENAILRWTAPGAGTYHVNATFMGEDSQPTTTDVSVYHRTATLTKKLFGADVMGYCGVPPAFYPPPGVPLSPSSFTGGCSGPSPVQHFAGDIVLAAGDAIDFNVGYGINGYGYDTTGLDVVIAPVANVAITHSVTQQATEGGTAVYLITVSNSGPSNAGDVVLASSAPIDLTTGAPTSIVAAAPSQGACQVVQLGPGPNTTTQCSLGTIAPGSNVTVSISASLSGAQINRGDSLQTIGTVSTSSLESNLGNNSNQLTMRVH
jgi:uncharacterized repeat protein (TIGR01451 family)